MNESGSDDKSFLSNWSEDSHVEERSLMTSVQGEEGYTDEESIENLDQQE